MPVPENKKKYDTVICIGTGMKSYLVLVLGSVPLKKEDIQFPVPIQVKKLSVLRVGIHPSLKSAKSELLVS